MKFFTVSTVIIIFFSSTQSSASKLSDREFNKTRIQASESGPHPAIIEGAVADIRKFPYAVRIYVSYFSHRYSTCTAQAVHPRLVITAAHCLQDSHKTVLVVAGHEDHSNFDPNVRSKLVIYVASEVFSHPLYFKNQQNHDVAIVKTKFPMDHPGHAFVKISYQKITGPVTVSIYGWGLTTRGEPNNVLHAKELKAEVCSLTPLQRYKYLCLLEKGIALGDSGGGMIYNGNLIGIASFYEGPPWTDFFNPQQVNRAYYYTMMYQEHFFVEECISKNESHHNSIEDSFTLAVSILLLHLIINLRGG